jgi:hypothetical protein
MLPRGRVIFSTLGAGSGGVEAAARETRQWH